MLMKFEYYLHIFEKYSARFHENPSSGSRVVPCRRTLRHPYRKTERYYGTNSRFPQFCVKHLKSSPTKQNSINRRSVIVLNKLKKEPNKTKYNIIVFIVLPCFLILLKFLHQLISNSAADIH